MKGRTEEQDQPLISESRGCSTDRRPFIDHVSSRWRDEKDPVLHDEDVEDSCSRRRPSRRMLLIIVLCLSLALLAWTFFLHPRLDDDWEIKEGFQNGTFGMAKGGDFDGTRIEDLSFMHLPGGMNDPAGERRLVFVGDIHGCARELKMLLEKVGFDEEMDHLITVGDVISKGPENVEVLDELMRLGASNVRGNHEDRILALAPTALESPSDADILSKGSKKDAKLLRKLSKHHIKYLQDMPLMLRIPALPRAAKPTHKPKSPIAEEIMVVHAGLVPAVTLEKQDPYYVMNMRSIKTKTHLPLAEADAKKSKPWHDIWEWYNDRLFRKKPLKDFQTLEDEEDETWAGNLLGLKKKKKWPKPRVVVYGHHRKAGLQIRRWSKGLDTGCVAGDELTALVLDAEGRQEIVSVGCKDHR